MSVETDKSPTAQETPLSGEELGRISAELIDLSLATLRRSPRIPGRYKKNGAVRIPHSSPLHGGLVSIEYKVVEGGRQFRFVELSRDIENGVNTHIWISSGLPGSIAYLEIPLYRIGEKPASFRRRLVFHRDSFEAEGKIRAFWAGF